MTREEAIINLNMIAEVFIEPSTVEQAELIDETFDVAIKALEQEPCDCISIQTIKEQMIKYGFHAPDMTVTEFVEDVLLVRPQEPKTANRVKNELNRVKTELKQEDCISRQAVLARIDDERKHLLELKMNGAEHIVVHHARRIIEDMPPVNSQEQKTGHWLRTGETDVYYDLPSYECDKCGQYSLEKGKYCPNCGARISEVEE